MKVLINRKPVSGPWGGGNLFVSSFCEYMDNLGHQVVHTLDSDLDMIFLQDPRYSDLGISINEIAAYKRSFPSVKVVHRVNECDARKGTSGMDELLRDCSRISDHTIFVSNWIRDYHINKGWHAAASVLYNGVDDQVFKPGNKIDNNKINIVTHHWSDNPLKGADIYAFLDDWVEDNQDYTFTYIGRPTSQFKNTNLIPPLSGADLGKELSRYDVYVSGSRFDPGPNHIIESIACEIPTLVHMDGGGACEFAGISHVYYDTVSLVSMIKNPPRSNHVLVPRPWKECIYELEKILVGII